MCTDEKKQLKPNIAESRDRCLDFHFQLIVPLSLSVVRNLVQYGWLVIEGQGEKRCVVDTTMYWDRDHICDHNVLGDGDLQYSI